MEVIPDHTPKTSTDYWRLASQPERKAAPQGGRYWQGPRRRRRPPEHSCCRQPLPGVACPLVRYLEWVESESALKERGTSLNPISFQQTPASWISTSIHLAQMKGKWELTKMELL
ncbi:unnamed protein product [Boreogadus saida]